MRNEKPDTQGAIHHDPGPVAEDLIATTLDGDLLVFDLEAGGPAGVQLVGPPLHWSIHDGALGGCNGLLVRDYDPEAPGIEVYVASTRGVLKFTRPSE